MLILCLPSKTRAPIKAYSLMPVIAIVFTLNDVVAPAVLGQMSGYMNNQIEAFYFIGIILGIAVIIILQGRFSMNICIMLNLAFAFLAIGFVVDIARFQHPELILLSALVLG